MWYPKKYFPPERLQSWKNHCVLPFQPRILASPTLLHNWHHLIALCYACDLKLAVPIHCIQSLRLQFWHKVNIILEGWSAIFLCHHRQFTASFLCMAVSSLWPCYGIWQHRTVSILAQVRACCLTAPSHYLNQCFLVVVQWSVLAFTCKQFSWKCSRYLPLIFHPSISILD